MLTIFLTLLVGVIIAYVIQDITKPRKYPPGELLRYQTMSLSYNMILSYIAWMFVIQSVVPGKFI